MKTDAAKNIHYNITFFFAKVWIFEGNYYTSIKVDFSQPLSINFVTSSNLNIIMNSMILGGGQKID